MRPLVSSGPRDTSVRFLKILYRLFPFCLKADGNIGDDSSVIQLSITIPTYFRHPNPFPFSPLKTCLTSISEQGGRKDSFEVIVVEDGPLSEQTHKIIQSYEKTLPIRHIKAGNSHQPLGRLRNLSLEHARGHWILIMDDDAILAADFLRNFYKLKGQIDPNRDILLPHGTARYGLLEPRYDFLEDYSLSTQCIIYPRPLLKKIGGLHSFLQCFEDIDLAMRALLEDGKTLQASELRFFHPPIYLALGSPIARQRGWRYSQAYRHLKQVYSLPIWMALIMKDILKLPHLLSSFSPEKRHFAVLALYTLLGLLKKEKTL